MSGRFLEALRPRSCIGEEVSSRRLQQGRRRPVGRPRTAGRRAARCPRMCWSTAGHGDCWICEAGRGREPVSGDDVERDPLPAPIRAGPHGAENRQDQAKRRDELAQPIARDLCAPSPTAGEIGKPEHQVRGPGAENTESEFGKDVGDSVAPADSRREAATRLTAGFMCAPEIGPSIVISTNRIAPVAACCPGALLHRFRATRFWAMIPDPITAGEQEERSKPPPPRHGGRAAEHRARPCAFGRQRLSPPGRHTKPSCGPPLFEQKSRRLPPVCRIRNRHSNFP